MTSHSVLDFGYYGHREIYHVLKATRIVRRIGPYPVVCEPLDHLIVPLQLGQLGGV